MEYKTPMLKALGSLSELTLGGGGSVFDGSSKHKGAGNSGTTQPPKRP